MQVFFCELTLDSNISNLTHARKYSSVIAQIFKKLHQEKLHKLPDSHEKVK